MELEIDVSGEDLLSPNYSVCVANKNSIIKGFKMPANYVREINSKYADGKYKYKNSQKQKATLKVRIYTIIIYKIFKNINSLKQVDLVICRDFPGREEDIKNNLKYFLEKKLGIIINSFRFSKLEKDSNADKYAHLMSKDSKNKLNTYVSISLEQIEKYLKK